MNEMIETKKCRYCGNTFIPDKSNVLYCRDLCSNLMRRCTCRMIFENVDELNANDRYFYLEFPLIQYNKTFNRNVGVDDFKKTIIEILDRKYVWKFEVLLATAYYIAAKKSCSNYISFYQYMNSGHFSFKKDRMKIKDIYDYKSQCKIDGRTNAYVKRSIKKLSDMGEIGDDVAEKMKELYERIKINDTANFTVNTAYAYTYLLTHLVGYPFSQEYFFKIFDVSVPTIHNWTMHILKHLRNEGKVSFEGDEIFLWEINKKVELTA